MSIRAESSRAKSARPRPTSVRNLYPAKCLVCERRFPTGSGALFPKGKGEWTILCDECQAAQPADEQEMREKPYVDPKPTVESEPSTEKWQEWDAGRARANLDELDEMLRRLIESTY